MTAAIIGLIGVVVGSLSSTFVSHYLQKRADERRWRREDVVQLREERLKLYRDYNLEIRRVRELQSFNEAKLREMMSEIELIGSDEVTTYAVPLFFEALDFWLAADTKPGDPNGRNPDVALMKMEKTSFKYMRAVQRELGIWTEPTGIPPKPLPKEERDSP